MIYIQVALQTVVRSIDVPFIAEKCILSYCLEAWLSLQKFYKYFANKPL